jgi:putative ABC transport system permease protein
MMPRLHVLAARLWQALRSRQHDDDLRQQIASHLDESTEEYVRQGLSPEEARRAALRSFGGVTRTWDAWRDARPFVSWDHWWRDLRQAGRALRRNAGFSAVVIVILAMGTGSITALFTLLNTVVLQPLPFAESDRLVVIHHTARGLGLLDGGVSSDLYFDYRDRARSLESLAVYRDPVLLNLRAPADGTERVTVTYASAALFAVLRTRPALGRLFTSEDGRPGFMNMTWKIPTLMSYEYWVSRFGADPGVIGRTLTINDSPREIVGVLPKGFSFPQSGTELWVLLEPARRTTTRSLQHGLTWNAVGRLTAGATPASTQLELNRIVEAIGRVDPDAARAEFKPVVTPLKSALVGSVAPLIWLLFGGMGLLLVAACANAGGLFLVRAEHRAREMAVRRALGAHGPHLVRVFVAEAMILAGLAAGLGLGIANGILAAVITFMPVRLPRTAEIRLGWTAVLFAGGLAVLIAAFYGLVSSRRFKPRLLSGERWTTRRRAGSWGPDVLIAVQVALALALMSASALMVQTYRNLSHRPLGFSADHLLTVEITLPSRKADQHARIYHDIVDRVRLLPQVDQAAAASFVPLTVGEDAFPIQAGTAPVPFKFYVSGYFQTMRTPIVDGADISDAPPALQHPVLISAALARRLYPGARAVGRPLQRLNADGSVVDFGGAPLPAFTIAGVVADVREAALREAPTEIVYVPIINPPADPSIVPTNMTLVVRARVPFGPLAAAVKSAVAQVDPDVSIGQVRPMETIVGAARAPETFVGVLLLFGAVMSLFLGAVGVYGSVAQVVRRRTREIAIRTALGASRAEVIRLVTAGAVRAVLAGGAVGLALSLALTGALRSLLFGVAARDPAALAAVTGLLVTTAGIAALLAARRATHVPLVALSSE